MESNDFKKLFGRIALHHGFEYLYGGWFKENSISLIVLDLQRSNFSHYYYLNIKIYIHNSHGVKFVKSKDLVKKYSGDILRRQPSIFNDGFDLENSMSVIERENIIEKCFIEFIDPLVINMLNFESIKKYVLDNEAHISFGAKNLLGM